MAWEWADNIDELTGEPMSSSGPHVNWDYCLANIAGTGNKTIGTDTGSEYLPTGGSGIYKCTGDEVTITTTYDLYISNSVSSTTAHYRLGTSSNTGRYVNASWRPNSGSVNYISFRFAINNETEEAVIIYLCSSTASLVVAYEKCAQAWARKELYTVLTGHITPPTPPGPQGDATCKVNYYLQDDEYTYSKITFKEDTPPIDMNDGYVQDILASQSSVNIENLVEGQKYYFTIFTDKSESEPFPYIVGPVITDWVNAELPSPMLCGTLTKPYRYENQELISNISDDAAKALGYDAGETTKWLFDDLIPSETTSRAFWIFGNKQRGIYAYYHNISNQGVSAIKIYYKNTIIVDQDLEWIASTPVRRNGILYFGKNDITCKGSIIYLSFSTNWFDTGNTVIKPFLINDTNAYYFITGRPNPADYTWYINNINGTGFKWKDWQIVSGSGYLKFPFSDYTQWRSDKGDMGSGDFDLEYNGDARVFQTNKTRIDINTPDYVTYTAILNPTHPFESEYYDGISTYQYYTVGRGYYYRGNYLIQGMTNEVNGYPYTATGTLEEVLDAIRVRCKNVSIYVNGVCWSEV